MISSSKISDIEVPNTPYVFVLRSKEQNPLYVGAQGGSRPMREALEFLEQRHPEWWPDVHDYVLWHFTTEKRAWEYALHMVDELDPVYQPEQLDRNQTPPPALLEAMVNPDSPPPAIIYTAEPGKNE
jgi:hypothetical protein